jgi:hypothetical protein
LERENKFPRRVQVGENRVAWLETEIDAWIESRKRVPLEDGEAAAGEFVVRRLQRPDEQEEGAEAAAEEAAPAAAE